MAFTHDPLQRNEAYVRERAKGAPPMPPAIHVAVVACMDARLNVYRLLGLQEGRRMSSATPVAW